MIMTKRDKTRERRKLNATAEFHGEETLFTNEIAKAIGVVWPVADRLLKELVDEGKLTGDKLNGYKKKQTVWGKIKGVLHV